MNEQQVERLGGYLIAVVTAACVLITAAWVQSFTPDALYALRIRALLVAGLLMVLAGVMAYALLRHRVGMLLFGRLITQTTVPPDFQQIPHGPSIPGWYDLPRWALPASGVALLLVLWLLALTGLVSQPAAFTVMALLAFAALPLGLMVGESEEEDRRADLPLAMFGAWAVLYLLKTGLLLPVVAAASWLGYLVFVILVLARGYKLRWIPIGFLVLIFFNLLYFFAVYRTR